MPQKHLMIAIDWFGPYSLEKAREDAKKHYDDGLYMCSGRRPYQRKKSLQYIGIGKRLFTRIDEEHHKLQYVTRERQIWLGEVVTAEPTGRKLKVTKATLDFAEWLHARFLMLPLNEKKTKNLPPRSVTVLNRWWQTDFQTSRRKRPSPDWPDLLDYPGYDEPARLVWFGGRQKRLLPPGYAEP